MIGAMEESDPGRHRAPGGPSAHGVRPGIAPAPSRGIGAGESASPPEIALPVEIGSRRLRQNRLASAFLGLPLLIVSVCGLVFTIISGSPGIVLIALLLTVFLAHMIRPSVWTSRLLLDDSGIHWRTGIRESGVLPWSQVTGVLITHKFTSMGGGVTYHSASIVTVDGGATLVARGSMEQSWTADEMRLLTSVVDRYKSGESPPDLGRGQE